MLSLEVSADTQSLSGRLRELSVGGLVTYDELSELIGRNIRTHRHLLYSAIRMVEREDGAVFDTERGVGVRRLEAADAPKVGQKTRRSVRRAADRAAERICRATKRANDLPDDVARACASEVSSLRLLAHLSADRAQPKGDDRPDRPEPVGVTAQRMFERLRK